MKSTLIYFDQLNDQQKIDFINKNAPHINNFLSKKIDKLDSIELGGVTKLAQVEQTAQQVINNLGKNLQDFINNYGQNIEDNSEKLTTPQLTTVNEIFQKTIIEAVLHIIEVNKNNALSIDKLKSQIVMEQSSSILSNITNFNNQIEKSFPDITDQIMAIVTPALVCLIAPYSPMLATAISFAPVAVNIAKLLMQNIDFKSVFDKFIEIVNKFCGNEKTNEIYQTAEKVGLIAEVIDKPISSISKFNFTKERASEILKNITENPAIKKLIIKVADFADKFIPASKAEFIANIESVTSNIFSKIKETGINGDNLKKVEEVLNSHLTIAKDKVCEVYQQGKQIFDRTTSAIQAMQELAKPEKAISMLLRTAGINKDSIENIARNMSQPASNMSASATKVNSALAIRDPEVKVVAVKLGYNNVAELMLKNVATEQSISKEMILRK